MAEHSEGFPTFTSLVTSGTSPKVLINGTNYNTNGRYGLMNQDTGEMWPFAFWYPSGDHILGHTQMNSDTGLIEGNLKLEMPLSYHFKVPTEVLYDLLEYQAEINRGRIFMSPSGDIGPNNWTIQGGSGSHYGIVDTPTRDGYDQTVYLWTGTPGNEERYSFYSNAPSNLYRARRVYVRMWCSVGSGTDAGMAFKVSLYRNGTQVGSTKYIDKSEVSPELRHEMWWDVNLDSTYFDTFEVGIVAHRGYTGASPNPTWLLYGMDVEVTYDTTNRDLLDEASFQAIDSYFADKTPQYDLDGSFYDKTIRDAILEVLSYAPEVYIYLDHALQLKCGILGPYSDETDPAIYKFSDGSLLGIKKDKTFRDRRATSISFSYNTIRSASLAGYAAAYQDNELGYKEKELSTSPYHTDSVSKNMDMPMLRELYYATLSLTKFADIYFYLYSSAPGIRSIEITTSLIGLTSECGDIVALRVDSYGWDDKKFLVVSKSIDIDKEQVIFILYDMELDPDFDLE